MKNITLLIVSGFVLLIVFDARSKDCTGSIRVYNGTHVSTSGCTEYFSISYCSELRMMAIFNFIGTPGDSTDWYLDEGMVGRTYGSDTFYATLPGTYTAKIYLGTYPLTWTSCTDMYGYYCGPSRIILSVATPCPAPSTGFFVTNITSTKATLNWNTLSCAIGYKVRYRADQTSTWTKKSVSSNTGLKKLTQLSANTTYQWGVKTKCGADPNVFSDFSPTQTFTTPNAREGAEQSKLKDELVVYPNPASQNIFIDQLGSTGTAELRIMNYLGQIVLEKIIAGDSPEPVQISDLPKGNYFIIIMRNDQVLTGEFIKE